MPEQFYKISPRDFVLMAEGYKEKKVDSYRQTRILMYTMVRLMGDPKKGPKSPEELWELPGDEKALSKEDAVEMAKGFYELLKKKNV